MQALAKKRPHHLRVFKVGVVGANPVEFDVINRIFTVTKYRTRCYQPVALDVSSHKSIHNVDFLLMCTGNPNVISSWKKAQNDTNTNRPFIFLQRRNDAKLGNYQLKSPVNPGKFIKLLDQYTIRELNFFPEFEIGHDSKEMDANALTGLRILRSANSSQQNEKENKCRALVVDDSYAVRKQMQIEFELLNADLDVRENAESALEAVDKNKYDIIFLDVVMPGMDGYSACKQIKRSVTNKGTPVILLTSRSSSFDKIKGTLAGCDAYLIKPINHNEFESVYNKFVKENPGENRNGRK